MGDGIGRSTSASTATLRADVSGPPPASFRYNNPGAQYPSSDAARFGQTGYGIIGGGHKIARFPSPVNGAAANFDLLYRNYTGMSIGAAGRKWTGAHGFGVPGFDPQGILSKQMLDDAPGAIALLKAIAKRESGSGNNLTETQWLCAHQMFRAGSADAYLDGNGPVRAQITHARSAGQDRVSDASTMTEEMVEAIQSALKAQGFSPGIIDGDFGPNTQKAVRAFQVARGMPATGSVGPETAIALGIANDRWAPVSDAGFDVGNSNDSPAPKQSIDRMLMLATVLALLRDKPHGGDPNKSDQGNDLIGLLLPLLLQSAVTGRSMDADGVLTSLLARNPVGSTAPAVTPDPQLSPPVPGDLIASMSPVLLERLSGRSATAVDGVNTPDAPEVTTQPATSRPSVQLSAGVLGISTILQAIGIVGTPFGTGQDPTTTGTLATLVPIMTGLLGSTGTFGSLLNATRGVLGGPDKASGRPAA